jgi:hypothetical protein
VSGYEIFNFKPFQLYRVETSLKFMKLLNSAKSPLKRLRIHNIFRLYIGLCSAGFGEGPVVGLCEYGNEPLRTSLSSGNREF